MKKTDPSRQHRLSLLLLLASGVFLSPTPGPATSQFDEGLFKQHEFITGPGEHQTVLSGFLLGGSTAEIVVVDVVANGDRRVRFFEFGGHTWELVLESTLGREVLFVDVADLGERDRLITYEHGRLSWFDTDSATQRTLVEAEMNYHATSEVEIPHVDITRDLNGDDRDDLVVPDVTGFWIATQLIDGSFTDLVKLGPTEPYAASSLGNLDVGEPASEDPRTYEDLGTTASTIPTYLSRIHGMDYNQDGRLDLVFWNEDHFEAHLQDEAGQFSSTAETFTTDVPFDSEGAYSRAFEFSDQGVASTLLGIGEKTKRTVLHSMGDLNGDDVADLVTLTLSGRTIAKQSSVYQVHLGTATQDGTVFTREAANTIHPRGKAGGMQPWGYSSQSFQDLDGDGQIDIMFRDVNVGIGGMVRALVGNSVPITLEFYRTDGGLYPDKPTTTRRVRRFAPFDGLGNVFFPPVLLGDVDGDDRSDLLVGHSPKELYVFLGVPGPDLLTRQPHKVAVALPYDERDTRLLDLNKDGKQDLLIHHQPADDSPTEPNRVTLLIAR